MTRIAITLCLLGAFSALAYYVWTHPDRGRLAELEREYQKLEKQNDQLAEKNEKLRREIRAMREDPRLAEREARARGGLARPNELVVQFERDERDARELQVEMQVEADAVVLAGERLKVDGLSEALARMHERLPGAKLTVRFGDEIGPLRKERVIEVVDDSELAPVEYRSAD
jgi:cell division protein FtsB